MQFVELIVWSSIAGVLSPVPENFRRRFPDPTDRPWVFEGAEEGEVVSECCYNLTIRISYRIFLEKRTHFLR